MPGHQHRARRARWVCSTALWSKLQARLELLKPKPVQSRHPEVPEHVAHGQLEGLLHKPPSHGLLLQLLRHSHRLWILLLHLSLPRFWHQQWVKCLARHCWWLRGCEIHKWAPTRDNLCLLRCRIPPDSEGPILERSQQRFIPDDWFGGFWILLRRWI